MFPELRRSSPKMVVKLSSAAKRDMLTPTWLSGDIAHSEIIGRDERDLVKSSRGKGLRVNLPTLAEYITMTPRIVTPVSLLHSTQCAQSSITPPVDLPCQRQSKNLIASLLDIHASPLTSYPGPPLLEILEAGTGHGGLTLYLAKAIHAANALRPRSDSPS